jgi:perosamine synthetase
VIAGGRLTPLPPLPVMIHVAEQQPSPFPLGLPGCRLYERARHGLWHGVAAAGLVRGDVVLAPAFHHGSEIEAFERAGLQCRFYEVAEDFGPDPAALDGLLDPKVRALHLVHYLGFPQPVARWRRWCDERNLLLIEDAAQAWLAGDDGVPLGSSGDLSVFCLYKTYGVPDGAALFARVPPAPLGASSRKGISAMGRRHASWFLQRSSSLSWLRERFERPPVFDHTEDIALGEPNVGASMATLQLVPRLTSAPAARRRANYGWLLSRLSEVVPQPFRAVPAGASPFVFPVETADKDGLAARLRQRRIDALSFWTYPHPSLGPGYPLTETARQRWLGLPVHQELRQADLEHIADSVSRCL